MITITVDDRQLVVTRMNNILTNVAPEGEHHGFIDVREVLDFASKNTIDVAFLDVEMPDMSGVELAEKLQEINPEINIIFITGYKDYMMDAFNLYASGYLMKPIREDDVRNALAHLRYPLKTKTKPAGKTKEDFDMRVQCFGNFEIYFRDEVMAFPRSRCKELIAYLIDRKGAFCTNDMIMGVIWPDRVPTVSLKSMMRTLIADTKKALEEYGITDLLIKETGGLRIDKSKFYCDYYQFLEGDLQAERKYLGEYMSQYSFAEETRGYLFNTRINK